jgi:hypothetical protein
MIYIKLVQTHQTTNKQYTHILFMYNSDIQTVAQYIYQYMNNV